jgi:hypothetical protein
MNLNRDSRCSAASAAALTCVKREEKKSSYILPQSTTVAQPIDFSASFQDEEEGRFVIIAQKINKAKEECFPYLIVTARRRVSMAPCQSLSNPRRTRFGGDAEHFDATTGALKKGGQTPRHTERQNAKCQLGPDSPKLTAAVNFSRQLPLLALAAAPAVNFSRGLLTFWCIAILLNRC